MEKIRIMIILVNIEISIIQTIIFEFENMMHLIIISLQKDTLLMRTSTQNGQIENNVQLFCNFYTQRKNFKLDYLVW